MVEFTNLSNATAKASEALLANTLLLYMACLLSSLFWRFMVTQYFDFIRTSYRQKRHKKTQHRSPQAPNKPPERVILCLNWQIFYSKISLLGFFGCGVRLTFTTANITQILYDITHWLTFWRKNFAPKGLTIAFVFLPDWVFWVVLV